VFVGVIAYVVVDRLAVRKGYAGPMPGLIAAMSFVIGVALGLGLGAVGALEPLGWHEVPVELE
jgi:hypothetical protein